ncbi:hypothetical protein EJ05DRAFT_496717 [Pseudovirgaria hyperparasitica]|uniref:Uncharacterized protein n=1 Tax=Pseudovirgaria hyperparasitica TaxID=470096 RepID=A0A6A6WI92_9PEZI|nr:uncharacterized protein EJ05DRAFT_496717 [Pseudovirgaria hyperparasitica]KAF2761825.1 hypothetical protein EJ05DRAFT_496717 [Pseudovirgaria hyperparasitica]
MNAVLHYQITASFPLSVVSSQSRIKGASHQSTSPAPAVPSLPTNDRPSSIVHRPTTKYVPNSLPPILISSDRFAAAQTPAERQFQQIRGTVTPTPKPDQTRR